MLDIIICLLTNLFRIFLIDRCVSFFVEKPADGRERFFVCACFYLGLVLKIKVAQAVKIM